VCPPTLAMFCSLSPYHLLTSASRGTYTRGRAQRRDSSRALLVLPVPAAHQHDSYCERYSRSIRYDTLEIKPCYQKHNNNLVAATYALPYGRCWCCSMLQCCCIFACPVQAVPPGGPSNSTALGLLPPGWAVLRVRDATRSNTLQVRAAAEAAADTAAAEAAPAEAAAAAAAVQQLSNSPAEPAV
jgi:hypothetical protein